MKIRAFEVLERFIEMGPARVLDVGSGSGSAAKHMQDRGIVVMTIDNCRNAGVDADYMDIEFEPREGIWCSHVLEHCFDVQLTLRKFKAELVPNGVLAITVPPMRSALVGGHLSNFTPGTLIYNLVLAGFDCSRAIVYTDEPGNISVIVRNVDLVLPAGLISGPGDLEKLVRYFPCPVWQHCDGRFKNINW